MLTGSDECVQVSAAIEVRMAPQQMETTLYSLSKNLPGPDDRRDGDRHMTLYRVGSLSIDERRELCLIKNISAGGMMARVYCTIPQGPCVSVELKCGQPIAGTVTWFREPNVGISFDRPVDVIEILSASLEGPRPRMPRIAIDSIVTVRDGASIYRLRSCDVSQGGIKLHCETPIEPGSAVVVTLSGLEPQPAVVRWSDSAQMGLTFNRSLPLHLLVEWLQDQRDRSVRAAS